MRTHVPGFWHFFSDFLHHFRLAKLATISMRVKMVMVIFNPFHTEATFVQSTMMQSILKNV